MPTPTGTIIRHWDGQAGEQILGYLAPDSAHPFGDEQRLQAFDWVFPLHQYSTTYYDAQGNIHGVTSEVIKPVFGWHDLWGFDQLGREGARLQADLVLRLADAKHIVYEEFWAMQADILGNWFEFIASRILDAVMSVAGMIIEFATSGAAFLLEIILNAIKQALNLRELSDQLKFYQGKCLARLNAQVMPQRGLDYHTLMRDRYEAYLRRTVFNA